MDASLAALYQEMILDHYRRPRNKGELPDASVTVPMRNPLCGDEITLSLALEPDAGGADSGAPEVVREARFTGRGCSISQASASMLTELVRGKPADEVARLGERFRAMVMGDEAAASDPALGPARALAGVARFPARVRCALLAWNAVTEGLATRR